jgi:CRP-like cAMP-binding protein
MRMLAVSKVTDGLEVRMSRVLSPERPVGGDDRHGAAAPVAAPYPGDHPLHRLSPDARAAWNATFLAALPSDVARQLLERAIETRLAAGETFYRGAHHADTSLIAIVIDGLLRLYLNAPDGRAVTVRYAGHGEFIGARGLALSGVAGPAPASGNRRAMLGGTAVNGEVLQACRILSLPMSTLRHLARTNATLASLLAAEVARQAMLDQELLAANVFHPIRARVAHHLLNLAVRDDNELVVTASHQDIADAIGSVREVVSRTMCGFQGDGLVQRRGRRVVLTDAARLHAASSG